MWVETKVGIRFILLNPADKPFPDLHYVLLRKLEFEAEIDEFNEITEVVVISLVRKAAIEYNRSDKQSPLRPGFGGKR